MKEAKPSVFPLRIPENIKLAIKSKADKEGLSINAAIIQRLVKSLQGDEKNDSNATVQ